MRVCDRFIGEIPLDLPLVLRQSNPRTPILLLHKQEQEGAEKLVADFAARKQSRLLRVVLSGTGTAEERTARKLIHKAMAEVRWSLSIVLTSFDTIISPGFSHHLIR